MWSPLYDKVTHTLHAWNNPFFWRICKFASKTLLTFPPFSETITIAFVNVNNVAVTAT